MHGVQQGNERDILDARTSARLSLRLRQARQMRGMTLKVLADAAGCSESLLSKIENGKAYPSLPMLNRLVQALDLNMGWMFDDRDGKEPVILRAGQRAAVPAVASRLGVSIERVIADTDRHLLQCNIYHIEAGALGVEQHQHAGEEAGYVLEGSFDLSIDGRLHRLATGDAFAFRSDQLHAFSNPGSARATLFLVSTPPVG